MFEHMSSVYIWFSCWHCWMILVHVMTVLIWSYCSLDRFWDYISHLFFSLSFTTKASFSPYHQLYRPYKVYFIMVPIFKILHPLQDRLKSSSWTIFTLLIQQTLCRMYMEHFIVEIVLLDCLVICKITEPLLLNVVVHFR